MGSLLGPAGVSTHPSVSPSITPSASPFLPPTAACASPLFSLPAGLELHINEDGGGQGSTFVSHLHPLCTHSPVSSLSAASDLDLDSSLDASANMLSYETKSLLVLSHSASSNSNLMSNSPSSSSTTTTPSLTSVNTVLDRKFSKGSSPSVERVSPSNTVCLPETFGGGSASFNDLDLNSSVPPPWTNFTPPVSGAETLSVSPPSGHNSSKGPSLSPSPPSASPLKVSSPLTFTSPSALQQPPTATPPSLDEALDKLLEMSLSQNHSTAHVHKQQLKMRSQSPGQGKQEVQEELILPMDSNLAQPYTFTSATNTITDESVDGGTDANGDLDWADEELSMSLHDGLDGTMSPYTERPYTDGSMTPLTEASWMDMESMTPSTCPGTPDMNLDLPMMHTPNVDQVSASGHVGISTARNILLGFSFLLTTTNF